MSTEIKPREGHAMSRADLIARLEAASEGSRNLDAMTTLVDNAIGIADDMRDGREP